ncbi:hypothetical protein SELMODRAFT_233460 [Selaginella moellendorffii]|uniref:Potassium transporter n=1 Tax=Selaginella moellendorffii TaxID=88036 RepID=D8S9C7_SELML|nr:hypothetical protein SELMODRAFT_233460 [Selaginella moellendorffii]
MEESNPTGDEAPPSRSGDRTLSRYDSLERIASKVSGLANVKVMTTALLLRLAFQSIGVVYGDLGTSPLYVFSSTFPNGIDPQHVEANVLGVLSLIIYTLTLSPLLKYVLVVLQASDNNEGGTFAVYTLLCRSINVGVFGRKAHPDDRALSGYDVVPRITGRFREGIRNFMEGRKAVHMILLLVTLLGTCMVIGDGTLTPAISVISAVQGIQVQVSSLGQNIIVAISVVILVLLFNLQRFGTDKVGFMFAPVLTVWFVAIGVIGLYNIGAHDLSVLRAFNPKFILDYFLLRKLDGFISLGGVVLCITGTEAMFADVGHFSARSIQIAFVPFVYPTLLLAYCGQAAYLMKHPEDVANAFYKSVPAAVYWPMFVVAVLSAIIASQAMISAVFQIIKQSQAMSCFPRVKVVHTSKRFPGQVYIPEMNWFLMLACVVITIIFKNTTTIGNAYGICVVSVMSVTTFLTAIIMLLVWKTNILLILAYFAIYAMLELTYFSSVLVKFTEGGWLPMLFAAIFMSIMFTWFFGSSRRNKYELENKMSVEWITGLVTNNSILRVRGVGLIYTRLSQGVPAMLSHYVSNVPAIHSVLVFVTIKNLPVSSVVSEERFLFKRVGSKELRIYRCIARYGYRDHHRGDNEFENSLFQSLERFIRLDEAPSSTPAAAEANHREESDGTTRIEVFPVVGGDLNGGGSAVEQEIISSPQEEDEEEIEFLRNSRRAGVVYVLGHTEVVARKDSSVMTKFFINTLYAILRKNFRESRLILEVPHERLLKIGNVAYI